MKVTFSCETCGFCYETQVPDTYDGVFRSMPIPPHARHEVTFGPLTEAMVADALINVADRWYLEKKGTTCAVQRDLASREARFVLRLMHEAGCGFIKGCPVSEVGTDAYWRDWLLSFAKEEG